MYTLKRSGSLHLLGMTSKAVAEICDASDKHELQIALHTAARSLGFDSFNLGCEKSARREFMTDPTLTNWSYDDLVAYERDGWSERDPLLDYAATGNGPLYWSRSTWLARRQFGYQEYLASAGLFSGITVPLHGKSEKIGALTLLSWSDRGHDKDVEHAAAIIGRVAMARAAAIGLISGQESAGNGRVLSLSVLQREILKWVANGKSNSEIALIVAQSKRSIDYHVVEILRKLGVSSRAQAAAIDAAL